MGVSDTREVLRRFVLDGEPLTIEPFLGGHINDSYRVVMQRARGRRGREGTGQVSYVLQRVNPAVFPNPRLVMENLVRVTEHLGRRVQASGVADWRRRVITLVPARDGRAWVADPDLGTWRLYPFIEARVTDRAHTPSEAYQAARAFGRFLTLLADLGPPPLHETIPAFHDTRARFAALDRAVAADACGRVPEARVEIEALLARRALADVLPPLLQSGELPRRVVHNDAKISNVLFDAATGEAMGVVDLDTVMLGSALRDFGDLVRSTASPTDEDETDLPRVAVRLEFFEALARGFLEEAGAILRRRERELLVFAGRLLALEQAVRFLTDYLDGDRYYRTTRPRQNLDRCRTQLRLFDSFTGRAGELQAVVERASPEEP